MDQAAAGQPQQIPQYDVDPEDWVQDAARRENLYQDTLNDSFDFANSAAAGPGAFAPGAFDSTSTYTPVEQQGTQALRAYAARANTPEGIIAAGILAGSTARAEIAKLQQAYNEAEANGTLADNPILSQIPMAPPREYDGAVLPDWESLGFRMSDVEEAYFTESQGGTSGALFDPTTGEFVGGGNRQYLLDENGQPVLVDVETQMSEAAQRFADQGLSSPNDQFQAADLLDPNWQQQAAGADQQQQNFYDTAAMLNQLYASLAPQPVNGKTGLSAAPVQYGKGQQAALPPPGDANTLAQMEDAGASYNYQPGPAPAGSGSPIDMAIAAGRALPLVSGPGIDYARATTGNPAIDAATALGGWLGDSGFFTGWFGNGNDGTSTPSTPSDVGVGANYQASDPFVAGGVGNTGPAGVGGPGAGGGGAPRTAADLSGAPTAMGGPNPESTAGWTVHNGAIFDEQGRLMGYMPGPNPESGATPYGRTNDTVTSRTGPPPGPAPESTAGQYVHNGAVFDAMDRLIGYMPGPNPESGATPYGRTNDTVTSRTGTEAAGSTTTSGAPPGGYVHNGAIFDAQDRLVGYTPNSPGARTNATATSPVRIGVNKKSGDRRTNEAPTRVRNPKRARADTPATRQGWQDFWAASRSAGRSANETYGADYGRAAAAAYLMAQQGITPLSTQQAARRAAGNSYR
jgi:hypothetical protein